jgi:hypothetical protein
VTKSVHVEFVVDKVALDRFFSEIFGFPMSVPLHRDSPLSYIIWGPLEATIMVSQNEKPVF